MAEQCEVRVARQAEMSRRRLKMLMVFFVVALVMLAIIFMTGCKTKPVTGVGCWRASNGAMVRC